MSERKGIQQTMRELRWRLIVLTVAAIIALQLIAFYGFKYSLFQSLQLSVLMTTYLIVYITKEHRVANAFVGVILVYILGMGFTMGLDPTWSQTVAKGQTSDILVASLMPLVLGLVMAFAFARLTTWSEKKRAAQDAKRRTKTMPERTVTVQRVHRKKKRKK